MDAALANRLAVSVRAADPDRYFSALFAPSHARAYLFALYAFNHEVARVAETVREPMLGAIRLEWWRETVESAHAGAPRNHDVARGLAALFQSVPLALADFEPLIAARAFDANAEQFADLASLENYIDATGGGVMRLAARILGGDPGQWTDLPAGVPGLQQPAALHQRAVQPPRAALVLSALGRAVAAALVAVPAGGPGPPALLALGPLAPGGP